MWHGEDVFVKVAGVDELLTAAYGEWEWQLHFYFNAERDDVCIWQSTDEFMGRLVITTLTQMPTFSMGGADSHNPHNRTRTALT